jgi:PKD repeat protein
MSVRTRLTSMTVVSAMTLSLAAVTTATLAVVAAPAAFASQPVPGHTHLVPQVPRTDQPKITTGEIWDMAVIGNRIFVAGSFTGIANQGGATVPQQYLAAYDYTTGKVDTTFRPTFNGGVNAVEASPDGTKLFVTGTFSTINGIAESKVASLNLTTGAPVATFKVTGVNNAGSALAATNTTVYVGGRFTKINGVSRGSLAALNSTTGAVDPAFNLPITGGIGVNGELTVQQLKLTHDDSKLLVVHTGRQINGQDRLGMGLIDTAAKTLLPWRSHLWDDNLARVGGVTRIYAGDIAPNDQYFVVSSGSGGDFPPISDTAVAFPIAGGDNVQPLWIARMFDSVYSVAITEDAVYVGGHLSWNDSPTAALPYPGLDNVGYGTGQGIGAYALGDQVVRRDHIGALDPATGRALEWDPGSNSFEGNKAMLATPRGLFAGGDAMIQGGKSVGRVAFYDFNNDPNPPTAIDTTITTPIEGRVVTPGTPFTVTGTAQAPTGVKRVQVELQDRNSKRFLQADGVTWATTDHAFVATLANPGATTTTWSIPFTVQGNNQFLIEAKTFGNTGSDTSKALKKIESFGLTDQTPSTNVTGPSGVQTSTTFIMTGTGTDDIGVNSFSLWFRDDNNQYLQDDGSVSPNFNTFRVLPDVPDAPNATFSYQVTLPHEGTWRGSATAVDTSGQSDIRGATRDWVVSSTAVAPTVTITSPVAMTPPLTVPPVVVAPGGPMTFAGTAADLSQLQDVTISLRNTSTHESLAADGSWGVNAVAGAYRISPVNINASTYNWSYTTPFNLTPGNYTFSVTASDTAGLNSSRGSLTITAQVPGDAFPNGLLNFTGTDQTPTTLHLDLPGTATDDKGVAGVKVSILDNKTGRYIQTNGLEGNGWATLPATLGTPGATSTTFDLALDLPQAGDFSVTAYAVDTAGQADPSTVGATARYLVFPGDADPTFDPTLGAPISGTAFTQGVIVVSGRANDDISIAKVEVGIINSLGQYMNSNGTFTSTTATWRTAFLNSPGSTGSNFAYTTPVIPAGTYSVSERATDGNGQVSVPQTVTGITVTLPANNPPVAHATVSCVKNVCTFDGRTSTDEDVPSLTYAWSFGDLGTSTVPVPVHTYTTPSTFTVTLTVKDQWGATGTTTLPVTITTPTGNVAPVPTFFTSCTALACSASSLGTTDANLGDVITYLWNWGDGSLPTTGSTSTHTYATTGTYVVTLTATDGWGAGASITHSVSLVEPAGNVAPTPTFTVSCVALACLTNSSGTFDANGDVIRYSWSFGDGSAPSTAVSPSYTYLAAGTYTITLTVTDGWNRSASTTRTVTVA